MQFKFILHRMAKDTHIGAGILNLALLFTALSKVVLKN
jgi:hypothetical protein